MAKPILVIKVSAAMPPDEADAQKNLTEERLKGDYHVLVCRCLAPGAEIKFECVGFQSQ